MDNVCHTLAGAALGEAGLKERTALGMATLVIASNLPDVDVAVFATDTLAMSFRRGWTHGVLAMAGLPLLLALVMFAWARLRGGAKPPGRPARFAPLLLLACAGVWLHVLMDWMNSYGIRLLMPFSERWFYGDALYIVDPLLYLVFGVGVYLARRRARSGLPSRRPAGAALASAAVYMGLMLASNWVARAEVHEELLRAGRDVRFMVTPVFLNPFRREVIVDTGGRYEKGVLWFEPLPHFRPLGYGTDTREDDPAARAAAAMPRVQAFLRWSRFPYFVIQRAGGHTRVIVNDYRYSGPRGDEGWAAQVVEVGE